MRSYWDWQEVISINKLGTLPYTPATNLLLRPARKRSRCWKRRGWRMSSPATSAIAPRRAPRSRSGAWRRSARIRAAHSPALTGVRVPDGHDADAFRKVVLENFDMSLGTGLNKVKGKVFRIGHIGHFNDLMLMGTLAGVEMGLDLAKVPHRSGGVLAAMDVLKGRDAVPMAKAQVA